MKKFLLITAFILLPMLSHAAAATLFVDTGFDSINTIEATINVPASVTISDVSTGDSMVLIWIKNPSFDEEARTISFTGLTPGGFTGKGAILSFSGNFAKNDLTKFKITDVTALKNDGKGTPVKAVLSLEASEVGQDVLPPVPFKPVLGSSDDFSSGKPFVSFLTQDKGSGIDHYEYAAKFFGTPKVSDWSTTTSPLLLSRLETFKTLYIKAVDRAGNSEIAVIPGPNRYAGIFVIIILCIIIIVCAPLLRKRFLSS